MILGILMNICPNIEVIGKASSKPLRCLQLYFVRKVNTRLEKDSNWDIRNSTEIKI